MSSRQFEVHLLTLARLPSSLRHLSLMNFITKRQHPKPVNYSNPWVVRRNKGKRLKFNDKDLERWLEFDDVFGLSQYDTGWSASHGTNAYIEDEDDTSSISSCSTNATMDNIPGTGRTIDMCFYQPVGRAIEKFALKIAIRLNICHPSPAQILRFFRLAQGELWDRRVRKPSDVIADISAEEPSAVPGILSLVAQSQ